jgi:hypothetical protein
MAICNIFNTITNPTGTFFTFSQYTEDLTKAQTSPGYKVIPSKFICFDVTYSSFDNNSFPTLLQQKFENGCAILKEELNENWNAEISKKLFWNQLNNILNENNIVYFGDINIQSYSEQDGMGYSEIYCYIPNDAKKHESGISSKGESKNITRNSGDYVEGFSSKDDDYFSGKPSIKLSNAIQYEYGKEIEYTKSKDATDSSFTFNTVVVFYDIKNADGNIIYDNIPLGMYVTGMIDRSTKKMNNSITKFVSNDDIYSSGTSYGLRICSRITPTQNGTYIRTETNVNDLGVYESLTQAMSSMIDSQTKMDEALGTLNEHHQVVKDHLAEFKNSRTNVPYIKEVNDIPYWFINGRNTNIIAIPATVTENGIEICYGQSNNKIILKKDGIYLYGDIKVNDKNIKTTS